MCKTYKDKLHSAAETGSSGFILGGPAIIGEMDNRVSVIIEGGHDRSLECQTVLYRAYTQSKYRSFVIECREWCPRDVSNARLRTYSSLWTSVLSLRDATAW